MNPCWLSSRCKPPDNPPHPAKPLPSSPILKSPPKSFISPSSLPSPPTTLKSVISLSSLSGSLELRCSRNSDCKRPGLDKVETRGWGHFIGKALKRQKTLSSSLAALWGLSSFVDLKWTKNAAVNVMTTRVTTISKARMISMELMTRSSTGCVFCSSQWE